MKIISPDRTHIDYWHNIVNGGANQFGLRVWESHFSAITNTAGNTPQQVGDDFTIPIELGTVLPIQISTIINDHARQPDSDLIHVLIGEKSFMEATVDSVQLKNGHYEHSTRSV